MLESLGNVGDFLGGIGVLVTLFYLGLQIRQNTLATRADSYQDAVTALSAWSQNAGSDPEICRLILKGSADYDDLDAHERLQFNFLMSSFFRNVESIHAKFASGVIEPEVWNGWANRILSLLSDEGTARWWELNESAFEPRFRMAIQTVQPKGPLPQSAGDYAPPAV